MLCQDVVHESQKSASLVAVCEPVDVEIETQRSPENEREFLILWFNLHETL